MVCSGLSDNRILPSQHNFSKPANTVQALALQLAYSQLRCAGQTVLGHCQLRTKNHLQTPLCASFDKLRATPRDATKTEDSTVCPASRCRWQKSHTSARRLAPGWPAKPVLKGATGSWSPRRHQTAGLPEARVRFQYQPRSSCKPMLQSQCRQRHLATGLQRRQDGLVDETRVHAGHAHRPRPARSHRA